MEWSLPAAGRETPKEMAILGEPAPYLRRAAASFPTGKVHTVHRLVGDKSAAVLVDYERSDAVRGSWYSEHLHFFDMTLSRRPTGAKGCFEATSGVYRPVGEIMFLPAGFHYRGEGGRGRQKGLTMFVDCQAFLSREDLGGAVGPALSECISLQSEVVRDLLLHIAREVANPGFASLFYLEGLSLTLLVETARVLRAAHPHGPRRGGLAPAQLKTIEERVRAERAPPSLSELAELCRLSRRQLVRAYREETGHTIGAHVQEIMIDRAKRLLAQTSTPVGEVARQLGFAHTAAFSTAFRRKCGRSPRDYRNARGNG